MKTSMLLCAASIATAAICPQGTKSNPNFSVEIILNQTATLDGEDKMLVAKMMESLHEELIPQFGDKSLFGVSVYNDDSAFSEAKCYKAANPVGVVSDSKSIVSAVKSLKTETKVSDYDSSLKSLLFAEKNMGRSDSEDSLRIILNVTNAPTKFKMTKEQCENDTDRAKAFPRCKLIALMGKLYSTSDCMLNYNMPTLEDFTRLADKKVYYYNIYLGPDNQAYKFNSWKQLTPYFNDTGFNMSYTDRSSIDNLVKSMKTLISKKGCNNSEIRGAQSVKGIKKECKQSIDLDIKVKTKIDTVTCPCDES